MENMISRMLVEITVRNSLKSIKDDPERGIRKLVDMALQFSGGRFQQDFFSTAQTMLQNEDSAYYDLLREVIQYTDTERLFTFGMNLGYNGCTVGARRIRENEEKMACDIPWALILQMDTEHFEQHEQLYHKRILEGQRLGVYVWMLFTGRRPEKLLGLAREHVDSAFCIFCRPEDLSAQFLEEVAELRNVMLVVRFDENISDVFQTLRSMGLLYSVWYPYGTEDLPHIENGDLFSCTQQYSPLFTVLLAEPDCPEEVQDAVHQIVKQCRGDQTYHTLPWELQRDTRMIDAVISDDACSVYFDKAGEFHIRDKRPGYQRMNLFQNSLSEIFMTNCIKKERTSK